MARTLGGIPGADLDGSIHDYVPGQPIPSIIRDPVTGRDYVNELKKYVKPYTLVTEPAVLTLGAGALSDPIPMIIDKRGHFEIMQAFFQSSQPEGFSVLLFETRDRPLLMNRELHVATIASGGGVTTNYESFGAVGSAGRPFRWPESLFLNVEDEQRAIIAVFRNLSANSNTIRFALHGLRWYHTQASKPVAARMKQIYRTRFRTFPFFYSTDTNVILNGLASGEFDVRFTDEAWVDWSKCMAVSTGNFHVRIREKASGKRYMEQPIRHDLVFGNGEFPMLNWESSLFESNYKLTFELENNIPTPNTIWLTIATRKILWAPEDDKLLRPNEAGGM